jgi:hypothetical protein
MKKGANPHFAPPVVEGEVFTFEDEEGELISLEFLGLIVKDLARYGFFFPITKNLPAGSSGEILILEVTELDSEGQPSAFKLLENDTLAEEVYGQFREATKDLYAFDD